MPRPDFVIVGLGNPGPAYAGTRHNAGALLVEELAKVHGIPVVRNRHRSLVGEGSVCGRRCLLALPQTFMNLSGEAVTAILGYTETPSERLLVVHDDLDLAAGRIKLRAGGGAGGHRGVRSVMDHLGDSSFLRLKIGIGRPPPGRSAEGYVLERFSKEEKDGITESLRRGSKAVEALLELGPEKAMSVFNAPAAP